MLLKFWGTRGSIPVPGKDTLKYGGNTPCVEVRTNNELIILDAGSGIRELGKTLIEQNQPGTINIFISHYHWDHIQGIPFFMPLYKENNKIIFYGLNSDGINIEKLLSNQMAPNNFPIEIEKVNAKINYKTIHPNMFYKIDGALVETFQVNHSTLTLTYKVIKKDKCIVYMTDNEISIDSIEDIKPASKFREMNKNLIEFCKDCDYLIHDTMYEETAAKKRKGWGHSGNISLAYFSILAEVKNLILFHYNPDYTDENIDKLFFETCSFLEEQNSDIKCIAAKEGLEIRV